MPTLSHEILPSRVTCAPWQLLHRADDVVPTPYCRLAFTFAVYSYSGLTQLHLVVASAHVLWEVQSPQRNSVGRRNSRDEWCTYFPTRPSLPAKRRRRRWDEIRYLRLPSRTWWLAAVLVAPCARPLVLVIQILRRIRTSGMARPYPLPSAGSRDGCTAFYTDKTLRSVVGVELRFGEMQGVPRVGFLKAAPSPPLHFYLARLLHNFPPVSLAISEGHDMGIDSFVKSHAIERDIGPCRPCTSIIMTSDLLSDRFRFTCVCP